MLPRSKERFMTSCRTLLLAAVAALALLVPLSGTTSPAQASPHRSHGTHHRPRASGYHAHRHAYGSYPRYYVYWRSSPDDWWTCYGKYRHYWRAQQVADAISYWYDVDATATSYPICY
jgi:hypothetical protein